MTDYFDQLVEAGGREIAGGAIALVVGLTRIECDFLARAALTAALAHPLTDPCPTCSGDGFAARPGSYDRATGSEKPCAACDGTGRVPASVRLMLGERYDCARDQVATLREAGYRVAALLARYMPEDDRDARDVTDALNAWNRACAALAAGER